MPTRPTVSLLIVTRPERSRRARQVQSPSRDSAGYRRVNSWRNGMRLWSYRSIDSGWMLQVPALFISDNVLTHCACAEDPAEHGGSGAAPGLSAARSSPGQRHVAPCRRSVAAEMAEARRL